VPAPDVDDGLVAAPLELGEPPDPLLLALLHRRVERGALVGVLGEPRPEIDAEHAREDRLPVRLEPRRRAVKDTAEEVRKRAPARAEKLGGGRVAEDARLFLCEDAVARERAEEAVQRVPLGASLARELADRPWARGERVGDAEVGHDAERSRGERAAQEVPELTLGRDLAHPRARTTAAATSSRSPSARVRQSSRQRPSRTTA